MAKRKKISIQICGNAAHKKLLRKMNYCCGCGHWSSESKHKRRYWYFVCPMCDLIGSTQKWCWSIRFIGILMSVTKKSESNTNTHTHPRTPSNSFGLVWFGLLCVLIERRQSNGQIATKKDQNDGNDDIDDDDYYDENEDERWSRKKTP